MASLQEALLYCQLSHFLAYSLNGKSLMMNKIRKKNII